MDKIKKFLIDNAIYILAIVSIYFMWSVNSNSNLSNKQLKKFEMKIDSLEKRQRIYNDYNSAIVIKSILEDMNYIVLRDVGPEKTLKEYQNKIDSLKSKIK